MNKLSGPEQQGVQLGKELQGHIDGSKNTIAKNDLERIAQVFVDDCGDDSLLSENQVKSQVTSAWKVLIFEQIMKNKKIQEAISEAITWGNGALRESISVAVVECLCFLKIEQINFTDELTDKISHEISDITMSMAEMDIPEFVYNMIFYDLTDRMEHTEIRTVK